MSLSAIPYAVIALLVIALGGSLWGLDHYIKKTGALQTELDGAKKVIKEKEAARQSRAVTDQTVRKMAPAEKLERLK